MHEYSSTFSITPKPKPPCMVRIIVGENYPSPYIKTNSFETLIV